MNDPYPDLLRRHRALLTPSTLALALACASACDADLAEPARLRPSAATVDEPSSVVDEAPASEVGCPDGGDTCTWDERVRAAIDDDEDYDLPITSPVAGVELHDGRVPAWEVKDDPSGRRYIELDTATIDEDGTTRTFSGVTTVARWIPDDEELRLLSAAHASTGHPTPAPPPPTVHDPISPMLAPRIAAGPSTERVEVSISVRKPGGYSIPAELQKAIGRGQVTNRGELRHARVDALLEWQARVAAQQSDVAAEVRALGGRVTRRFRNLDRIDASIELGAIEALASHADVTHVGPVDAGDVADTIGGVARDRGSQFNQLLSDGYDGELGGGTNDDLVAAVVELGGLQTAHVGFRDTAASSSRLVWAFDCVVSPGTCVEHNFAWADTEQHASIVSGVLLGDLMDGQDPAFAGAVDRQQRSGVAREARFYFYKGGSVAWDDVPERLRHAHVVNNSWGSYSADPHCLGQDTASQASNDLYLMGHLPVHTAGNCPEGNDLCPGNTGCTISSPGSSAGALTVGGYANGNVGENDSDALRVARLYDFQSAGGVSWAEGRGRAIVDISAPACYRHVYTDTASSGASAYLSAGIQCGTSYSAPTVAGALLDFIDHYKTVAVPGSTAIDDPGNLHAFTVLFGDRQAGDALGPVDPDERMTAGLSPLWGAGRLKLRRLDAVGLDNPSSWGRTSVCIDDGEFYTINLGTPSADVDTVKVATYFYDPFHDAGSNVAKVDAYLRADGSYVALDYIQRNEARRLFYDEPGGKTMTLLLHGQDVSGADSTGCGANSRRVYVVWLMEDSDRDDADGKPCWDDPACSTYEIEPEDLHPLP